MYYSHRPTITCSGKTTWSLYESPRDHDGWRPEILSADIIRLQMFGNKYKYNKEKEIWDEFYKQLKEYFSTSFGKSLIIDNTNCIKSYITRIIECLPVDCEIEYRVFDVPYWKLWIRNWIRRWETGKWIPIEVLRRMNNNFKNIKNEYMVH